MRDIVLQVFALSVDGIIQTTGSPFDEFFAALPDDPQHEAAIARSLSGASLHAVGRATYEEMAEYFPTAQHQDGANPMTTESIDEAMNRIPKVVFSKTLERADWKETTILRGDTTEELDRLRRDGDGYVLVHGGASFARALVQLDAVDEYRLTVCPYVAGEGPKLFEFTSQPRTLQLVSAVPYANGVVDFVYRRDRQN